MTKKTLAAKAEIPYQTLMSAFRRSSEGMSVDYIKRIANVLGVSFVDLMGWDEQIDVNRLAEGVRFMEQAEKIGGNVYRVNHAFEQLNETGQEKVIAYAEDLLQIPGYYRDYGLTED